MKHIIPIPQGSDHDYSQFLLNEQQLVLPPSSYLLPFASINLQDEKLHIISYSTEGQSLLSFLDKNEDSISPSDIVVILENLLSAIEEIQKTIPSKYHGSIRKEIIFNVENKWKIADFQEIFKILKNIHLGNETPPELLYNNQYIISEKVDVWSLGWIGYELIYRKPLYDISDQTNFIKMLREQPIQFENIDQVFIDFLHQSLVFDPRKRIGIKEIRNLPVFKQKVFVLKQITNKKQDSELNSPKIETPKKKPRSEIDQKSSHLSSPEKNPERIDIMIGKEEILGRWEFELKYKNKVVDNTLFRCFFNAFNMYNLDYDFDLEEYIITNSTSKELEFNGSSLIRVFEKNNEKRMILRVFEADIENVDMKEFLKVCILERHLAKMFPDSFLNPFDIVGHFYENFEITRKFVIQLYGTFAFSFDGLLKIKFNLDFNVKIRILKEIILLFTNLRKTNQTKILAVFPYNIVLTDDNKFKVAFLGDMYVTRAIFPEFQKYIDPVKAVNYSVENVWKKSVYSLGILFKEFFGETQPRILEDMTNKDLTKRPSFQEILNKINELGEGRLNLDNYDNIEEEIKKIATWKEIASEKKAELHDILFNFNKSILLYENMITTNPRIRFYLQLAMNYSREMQPEKTLETTEKALEILKFGKMKNYKTKYHLLTLNSMSLLSLGHVDKAIQSLEKALNNAQKVFSNF